MMKTGLPPVSQETASPEVPITELLLGFAED